MSDVDDNISEMVDNLNSRNGNFFCGVVEGFYGRPWTPEQRKDLFIKMSKMGLNAYVYAPKDDCKHRAFWRELYSVEETEHLTSLILAAKENGICFYYALSPGLDITYSSAKEVTSLKRKLEQVAQFGCSAFALLFDDIEPEMGEADKEIFQSFAHAQVSITNEVYQHLGQPRFLFCPTEYSASRAIPNVETSEYLTTIGGKLLPGIDIMWTGCKVITKTITLQSIEELTEGLRRPPVIWDNLHANDYDQKRVFLGPYSGRSPDLIPHLHGILLNPNCEYEANFIPTHTLAQWSKCSVDGKRDLSLNDSISADIKLETESENGSVEDIPSRLGPNTYHPKKALKVAINDWLSEFFRPKNAHGKVIKPVVPGTLLVPPMAACMNILPTSTTTTTSSSLPGITNVNQLQALVEVTSSDASFQPIMNPVMNSLVKPNEVVTTVPPLIEEPLIEPMDCNPTPGSSPKVGDQIDQMPVTNGLTPLTETEKKSPSEIGSSTEELVEEEEEQVLKEDESKMQTDTEIKKDQEMTFDDVEMLVDLFYLPFEHGGTALQLMQEIHWIKGNAHVVTEAKAKGADATVKLQEEEWHKRAAKFDSIAKGVDKMFERLTMCQNRCLLYDVYPYIWDMVGIISLLNSHVKWLALGHAPPIVASCVQGTSYTWFTKGWKEAFMNGEQEPWVFRGGLFAELQRLLPLETANDLFIWKPPEVPKSKICIIRPYIADDQKAVYKVCRKTCDDGVDGSDVFPDHPDLMGDKLVGAFLALNPEYCFVVEDEEGICGYGVAALDAKEFFTKCEVAWIPDMCTKYPQSKKEIEMQTPAEEIISGFHTFKAVVPESLHKLHPSVVRLNVLPCAIDHSVAKRLLVCVMSALKANGSFGGYAEVNVGDKCMQDFYGKLGFLEINVAGEGVENMLYFGRVI